MLPRPGGRGRSGGHVRQIALFFAMAMAVSGCVSGDYAKAVGDFSKTVQQSQTVFTTLDQQSLTAEDDRVFQRARIDPSLLKFGTNSCERGSSDCTLVFQGRPIPAQSLVGNVTALLGGISGYAKGLNEIATADTRADIDKGMATIQTQLKSLAKTANAGSSPALNYVDPIGALMGWAVGTYLDQVRYDAAKKAVIEADPVIQQASKRLAQTARQLGRQVANAMAQEVDARRMEFYAKRSRDSYDALLSSVRTFDAFAKYRAEDQFEKLGTAHAGLRRAFESGNFGTIIEELNAWRAQLEEVGTIVGALVAASKAK